MVSPIFTYSAIRAAIVRRVDCPHCQHRFEVIKSQYPRQLKCLRCGRKFTVMPGKSFFDHYYK